MLWLGQSRDGLTANAGRRADGGALAHCGPQRGAARRVRAPRRAESGGRAPLSLSSPIRMLPAWPSAISHGLSRSAGERGRSSRQPSPLPRRRSKNAVARRGLKPAVSEDLRRAAAAWPLLRLAREQLREEDAAGGRARRGRRLRLAVRVDKRRGDGRSAPHLGFRLRLHLLLLTFVASPFEVREERVAVCRPARARSPS